MGCRRNKREKGYCSNRGAVYSLVNLIFGLVALSIKMTFKIVEVVFQTLFGFISLIFPGSGNTQKAPNMNEKPVQENNAAPNNVREFKKPENSKTQAGAPEAESSDAPEEVQNKDYYVVLFILTIIPVTVALAMGKLYYAGIIGAAGFGFIILVGIASSVYGSFSKKAAAQGTCEDEEEAEENDSAERLIKDAFEKLFAIRKDIGKIPDAEIRARLEAICCTGEKIIGEVRTNPEGLAHVRKFFYYYIDAFGEIVKKYLKLSSFEESSEEIGRLMAETEKSFADVDGIFKDLCEKLLEKDMMHLKAEISVIKNSN
ncbi:MAG: 5-bromo-4-chloroindolyl phosphate hydrolysis family protein [Clostridia bacterium]|nr:5-bromo-4-chloroindolyl phosphate hydrolysis family protein [Clostridia bacterium]